MAAAAPFEPRPHLALAVSGGADSMALALLARDWARARRGRVTALTVDHGLRAESAAEARRVGRWLARHGIAHRILHWDGAKHGTAAGLQARARAARYGLLEDWARGSGLLHLLTAHHRDDQAETWLLRLGQESGISGLAAMGLVAERPGLRLLRPLLGVARADLEAHLSARGQDWIRDPSNRDPAFARARLRALMPELATEGLDAAALARLAAGFARARIALEARLADSLARAAHPHPAGFLRLDRAVLGGAAPWFGARLLARALGAVGGAAYPAREARLERLRAELAAGEARGRTLAGCRILPGERRILICREAAAMAGAVPARSGFVPWDGRFLWRISGVPAAARLGALGEEGLAELRRLAPEALETVEARGIPAAARAALPALFDGIGVLLVPHIGYRRRERPPARVFAAECHGLVAQALAGPVFFGAPEP